MVFTMLLAIALNGGIVKASFNTEVPVENWEFTSYAIYGDDDEEILGKNVGGAVYIDGICYFLDTQSGHIIKLISEGDFQRISITGEGPGECSYPMNIINWPDPHHIGIFNPHPPLTLVNNIGTCNKWPDDNCPRNFEFGQMGLGRHILYNSQADVFVIGLLEFTVTDLKTQRGISHYRTTLFSGNGQRVCNLYQEDKEYQPVGNTYPIWWLDSAQRCLTTDSVFLITGETYSINQYSLAGELIRAIEQEGYPRRQITPKEAQYYHSDSRYAPDLHSLYWVDGRLLVLTSRGLTADNLAFDCFSFGDKLELNRVVLPGVKPSPMARYFWLSDDCLAIVYGAIQASMEVSDEHFIQVYERRRP